MNKTVSKINTNNIIETHWGEITRRSHDNLPISTVQIRPPVRPVASRILKSVNPALVRVSAVAIPDIPAPIMIIFGFSLPFKSIFSIPSITFSPMFRLTCK